MSVWTDYVNREEDKRVSEYKSKIIDTVIETDITESLIYQIESGSFDKIIKSAYDHSKDTKDVILSMIRDEKFKI